MVTGTVLDGRFDLVSLAKTGGFGAVYRAIDRTTGATVAVKLLSPGAPGEDERFRREVRLLAALDHPDIVRLIAYGFGAGGEPYVALEWIEGEDLDARLHPPQPALEQPALEESRLPIDASILLTTKVASALGCAHEQGIVHRDVKPSNILLVDGDLARPKLLDFGLARSDDANALTQTGQLVGTPSYMAPEQARGERAVDARVDVFALGCVLYECLTGVRAFDGAHAGAVLDKILRGDVSRAARRRPEVPDALDAAIAQMLHADPAQRPSDGNGVARLLERLQPVA